MINPNKMMFRSDRNTDNSVIKTIDGKRVIPVAIQKSRRTKKKRTNWIYHIEGTNIIVFNRSSDGVYFMRMALRIANINRYYNVFVNHPLTQDEIVWLDRYDYVLI